MLEREDVVLLGTLLLGCLQGAAAPAQPREAVAAGDTRFLELDVIARMSDAAPNGDAAWTAALRVAEAPSPTGPPLPPDVCRRADAPLSDAASLAHAWIQRAALHGPIAAALEPEGPGGALVPIGPHGAVDPAWAVGDLSWEADGAEARAEGAVRFGPAPVVRGQTRDDDGAVRLRWDADSVDDARVYVRGPAGELVCGTRSDGVRIPWWAVPARGGSVVLASTRGHATRAANGALIWTRATIERLIRLDRPNDAAGPSTPTVVPAQEAVRRSRRTPRVRPITG